MSERRRMHLVIAGLLAVSFVWEGLILAVGGVTGPYFIPMAGLLMFFPAFAGLVFLR